MRNTSLRVCSGISPQITGGRGNNLHEVETCDGSRFLVSMPTKFRKSVWIKRGVSNKREAMVQCVPFKR